MSKPPRCHDCNHRRKRIMSATRKRSSGVPAEPRQHKKFCDCDCHRPAEPHRRRAMPAWWCEFDEVAT